MAHDARISVTFSAHPKTKKLLRRHGHGTCWGLVCLFLWAVANRPDGDLYGMSGEDIELAVDWTGDNGALVAALKDVGFLDGEEGSYSIHDWAEHNPWAAGTKDRSEASKWAALCKRYGRDKAAELMPDYAPRVRPACDPDAPRTEAARDPDAESQKPQCPVTVSVSATVSDSKNPPTPPSGVCTHTDEFKSFWQAYPHKVGKDAAWQAWKRRKDRAPLPEMLAALETYIRTKPPDRAWCNPATWLNQGRWQDETPKVATSADGAPQGQTDNWELWKIRLAAFRRTGFWHDSYGPKPGEAGCRVPRELLVTEAA